MSLFQALILGVVQGLTEFIPVSSSGHLIIFPELLGWDDNPLVFDTTLHLATALALLVCFWSDIIDIFKSLLKDLPKHGFSFKHYSSHSSLGIRIMVGSIPVCLIGYLFGDFIESNFRSVLSIIFFLLLGSFVMYIGEKKLKKRLIAKDEISVSKSFKVGWLQALALLPGVSRSGATISGGMMFGLSRKEAARFSFLLSMPAVFAAGFVKLHESFDYFNAADAPPMFVGFISSFVVGIICIRFLLNFVRTNNLYPFIFYRLFLASVLFITLVL